MTPEEAIKIAIHCLGVQAEQEVCEECDIYGNCHTDCKDAAVVAIKALKEVQQYREIGTLEECREAVEKQKLKKPVKDKYNHNCCPNCGWIVSGEGGYGEEFCPHCENCGQAIRWENLGEMEDERD